MDEKPQRNQRQRSPNNRSRNPNYRPRNQNKGPPNSDSQPQGKQYIALYPVTGKESVEAISEGIKEKSELSIKPEIKRLFPDESIGIITVEDKRTFSNILKNSSKLGIDLLISGVQANLLHFFFKRIKDLNGDLTDTTLDVSNIQEKLGADRQFNINESIQTILYAFSVKYFEQRNQIETLNLDNNNITNPGCGYNIPFLFKNIKTISIAGNHINRLSLARTKNKIEVIPHSNEANNEDIKNNDEGEVIKEDYKKEQQSNGHNLPNAKDNDYNEGEGGENELPHNNFKPNQDHKYDYEDSKEAHFKKPLDLPPSFAQLNTRFQTVTINKEQNQYFIDLVLALFDPNQNIDASTFYAPTATFSYTVSEKIELTNEPLYNFLKANDHNLVDISSGNIKRIGSNLFFNRNEIFRKGLKYKSLDQITVMPTVAIGSQLFAVVANITLTIEYTDNNGTTSLDVNSINTLTIQLNESSYQILSHQIFFYC